MLHYTPLRGFCQERRAFVQSLLDCGLAAKSSNMRRCRFVGAGVLDRPLAATGGVPPLCKGRWLRRPPPTKPEGLLSGRINKLITTQKKLPTENRGRPIGNLLDVRLTPKSVKYPLAGLCWRLLDIRLRRSRSNMRRCRIFKEAPVSIRKDPDEMSGSFLCVGAYLSYQAASSQVLSARVSLTAVFGMGTGVPSPSSAPTGCNAVTTLRW